VIEVSARVEIKSNAVFAVLLGVGLLYLVSLPGLQSSGSGMYSGAFAKARRCFSLAVHVQVCGMDGPV
jgi:hypothetical protein